MHQEITRFLSRILYYPVVALFVVNLVQRRHMAAGLRKRYATLYLGGLLLAFWGSTFMILRFGLVDLMLLPAAGLCLAVLLLLRDSMLPFRLRCAVCGRRLGWREALYNDANMCAVCMRESLN